MQLRLLRKRTPQSGFGMLLVGGVACGCGDNAVLGSMDEKTAGSEPQDANQDPNGAGSSGASSSNPAPSTSSGPSHQTTSETGGSGGENSTAAGAGLGGTPQGGAGWTSSGGSGGASSGGSGGASSGGSGGASSAEIANSPPNWVFEESQLRTYEVTLDPAVWQMLQRNARDEEYVEANLLVEGRSLTRVGLRFKGAGTLNNCFSDDGTRICSKLSMKIKFDEYLPEQRFFGLKRLNFHSMIRDPSSMRERLAYRLFREVGVVAPRAVHAMLVVNGEPLGLFALVEDIDGRFTADRFVGGDGNLYKEAWPDTDDQQFLDQHLETNEDAPDHSVLLSFYDELRTAPAEGLAAVASRYMAFDALSAFLAVDRTISNWDGPMAFYCYEATCNNHNYFLYQHENEAAFTLIPWDLDHTFELPTPFDGVPGLFEIPQDCTLPNPTFYRNMMPPACDRLLQGYVRGGRGAYLAALERLLAGPFTLSNMESWLSTWQAQIEPAVAADSAGPGLDQFHGELDNLRGNLAVLRERALAELQERP